MKQVLLSLFTMCVLALNAQIVVDRSDFPRIGNLVVNAVDPETEVSIGDAGANQTWDFSNLIAAQYDSAVFIPVDQVPNYEFYPLANMASVTLNAENGFGYGLYNDTGDDIGIAGMDVQAEILPGYFINMHIKYLSEEWFHLPLRYNDHNSYTYLEHGYSAIYSNGVMLDSSKTITHVNQDVHVDAWGTMITPTGTFQVLRTKESQNWVDSSYKWNNGSWQFESAEPRSDMQYSFYAKDYGLVGSIDVNLDRASGMSFFISETVVDVNSPDLNLNASLYPNPATTEINISADQVKNIQVYNLTGQLQISASNLRLINIERLEKGVYFMKITTSKGLITKKFIKK